jgi:hypothetical protein
MEIQNPKQLLDAYLKNRSVINPSGQIQHFSDHQIIKFTVAAFDMIQILAKRSQSYKIFLQDKIDNNVKMFWDLCD